MTTPHSPSESNAQRRKIRDSCNNCSGQKIRCGKQRPSCARCSTKGLVCNYSFSQRTGRRSASSSNAQTVGLTNLPPSNNNTTSPSVTDSQSLFGPTITMTPSLSPPIEDASTRAPAESPNDTYFGVFDDTSFFPDLSLDDLNPATIETEATGSNGHWQNLPASNLSTSLPTMDPIADGFTLEQMQEETAKTGPAKTYHRGHDCMALALKVVYELDVMRGPCVVATSDPLSWTASSQNEVRDVDTVLFVNRDAAKSIKKILDCSCSSDRTVSLACYLAATKIVEWYGAAIGIVDERPEQGNNNENDMNSNNGRSSMADRIISRPIFMGKYCLDQKVQRAVRAKVVLSELKEHLQPLIARLPKFHVSGMESEQDHSFCRETDNTSMSCVLRNQLRHVIQAAKDLNANG